jgi:hypothetical protein
MTGVYYVTGEHLADMVAAQADPLIRAPRVKLGHTDALFGALAGSTTRPRSTDGRARLRHAGQPAHVEHDGVMLVADLAEVPAWLADAMPSAYPTRSAEWVWDYETAGGKRYSSPCSPTRARRRVGTRRRGPRRHHPRAGDRRARHAAHRRAAGRAGRSSRGPG